MTIWKMKIPMPDAEDNFLNLILKEEIYLKSAGELYRDFETKFRNRFDWIRSEFFSNALQTSLINDSREILKILTIGQDWNPDNDRQLNALYNLIKILTARKKY